MSRECQRDFDEALLSGYLDGVLTQRDRQRVRLHLEECESCAQLAEELAENRDVTLTTLFQLPEDDQWDETPRGPLSRVTFGLGWTVLVVWLVGMLGFAAGQLWSGPEALVEKLLVFGGVAGFLLLFFSVLVDRLRTLRTDPYRRIER